MFILIITIPFGLQAVKIAGFALWPFGRTLVKRADAGIPSAIGNVIWFVLAGWWLALAHLITAFLLASRSSASRSPRRTSSCTDLADPFRPRVVPIDSLEPGSEAVVVAARR